MKISICIPQYNRINFLLKSLEILEKQNYEDVEVVISDDCSSDNTVEEITKLKSTYKYPIVFHKFEKNQGYDRNTRKSIELASGDYCFIIGNDDTMYEENSISFLVQFLINNNLPDVGFCNFVEFNNPGFVVKRAKETKVLGTGDEIAFKHYSCFSFVGGLIFKKTTFDKYNTDKHDGSVFWQMYMGVLITASGNQLFSISEPLVLKDLYIDGKFRHSYRDRLLHSWKNFKKTDGGLFAVTEVLISALKDAGIAQKSKYFRIIKRVYCVTFPFWILDYKSNKSFISAIAIFSGMFPGRNYNLKQINLLQRMMIYVYHSLFGLAAIITPVPVFKMMKNSLYKMMKN